MLNELFLKSFIIFISSVVSKMISSAIIVSKHKRQSCEDVCSPARHSPSHNKT